MHLKSLFLIITLSLSSITVNANTFTPKKCKNVLKTSMKVEALEQNTPIQIEALPGLVTLNSQGLTENPSTQVTFNSFDIPFEDFPEEFISSTFKPNNNTGTLHLRIQSRIDSEFSFDRSIKIDDFIKFKLSSKKLYIAVVFHSIISSSTGDKDLAWVQFYHGKNGLKVGHRVHLLSTDLRSSLRLQIYESGPDQPLKLLVHETDQTGVIHVVNLTADFLGLFN